MALFDSKEVYLPPVTVGAAEWSSEDSAVQEDVFKKPATKIQDTIAVIYFTIYPISSLVIHLFDGDVTTALLVVTVGLLLDFRNHPVDLHNS